MMLDFGKESETVEFKESTGELKEGIKSIASMLNKNKRAILYFGITNKGKVIGQEANDKTLRDISQAISFNVEPAIIPTITALDGPSENLKVIKVEATGSDIPYSAYGQYLIRSADEDKKITREALRKMFTGAGFDFISEIESTRQDLTFEKFASILVSKGYHVLSTSSLVKAKGLKNTEGKYNIMAFILSDQSNISIKVVRFAGVDKTSMAQRTEFGNQCLLLALQQAMDYVEALNETNVDLEKKSGKRDLYLFDTESFQEAWKNACVHNFWMDMIPPAIYIYSDRLEIVSYGGLPYGLTLDEFYEGTSHPINKALWMIFNSAEYAEQTGHGVPTILSKYGKRAFKISDNYLTVTIPFAFKPTWAFVGEKQSESLVLSYGQKAILEALKRNPKMTGDELAKATSFSVSTIKKSMVKLQEMGLIKRAGSKRYGYWILK